MSLAFDLKFILSYDKKTFIYSYFATILLKKKRMDIWFGHTSF